MMGLRAEADLSVLGDSHLYGWFCWDKWPEGQRFFLLTILPDENGLGPLIIPV